MPCSPVEIVWFKRDLRLGDHRPLVEAAARGAVLPLYVVEPEILRAADMDALHWGFIRGSLEQLARGLARMGSPLVVRTGDVVAILEQLCGEVRISGLWSHEETGNARTFARDRAVKRWARIRGICWTGYPQNGVVRGLKDRDGWAELWHERMCAKVLEAPVALKGPAVRIRSEGLPTARGLGLSSEPRRTVQEPGEARAWETLESFLDYRGHNYAKEMSSPLTAEASCSRLSPYLAWGNISTRQVVQRTWQARCRLPKGRGLALGSFLSRCTWRCHFMQKLESEPAIERHNFNRVLDGLRESDWDEAHYEAFCAGQTGYPFVDACMRYLRAHGWINFRMRAMLTSFAAYDLWLHWGGLKDFLARQFLDYEPGIHISQLQMQSGTTGINTLRIYNPVKQGFDQDPEGAFVRRWVPELEGVPTGFIHEPWKLPASDKGTLRYPAPLVDHAAAVKEARRRIGEFRRRPGYREATAAVAQKHGSRKKPHRHRREPLENTRQRNLALGE